MRFAALIGSLAFSATVPHLHVAGIDHEGDGHDIPPMTDIDAKSALLTLLTEMGLEPGVSISLYEIGPPLIGQGISQDAIVNALYALKDEGVIDLPSGNRLVLLKDL